MKKKITLLAAFFIAAQAYAQQKTPDSALSFLRNNYPQEKVFVQTDKTWYFPGETIWMKAWCTLDGAPTYLSRILYVELANANGQVINKKMYKLDSLSSTPANIDLPENMASGNYSINAYTLWMLNFPGFVYRQNMYVYNMGDYKKSAAQIPANIQMHFFPEGGDMIANVKNRVAFKIINRNGMPESVSGYINDNTGKKLLDFATEHDGMGVFEIEPETGKTYTAHIAIPTSNAAKFVLPVSKEDGIGLRVENSNPNRLFVLLNLSEKNKEKYKLVKVVAQMHHQVVFKADLNISEGQLAAPVSKKNLPPGIMQITLFDAQNNPLAERLAFVENYSITAPVLQPDTLNKKARGSNLFNFSIEQVQTPTLSCLVTSDPGIIKSGMPDHIASSLLLTGDLKGYVHQPGYYFANKEAKTLQHLDLLLMTHGWRRFEWKKILHNEYAALKYPVESAISFRGTVTKSDSKEPVKDGKVSFIIKGEDSTSILAEALVTDKGEFLLDNVNYLKAAKVAYMGTNNKKANYIVDVKMNPTYIDSLKRSSYGPGINLDTTNLAAVLNELASDSTPFKNAKMLESVVVRGRRLSREDSLNREYAEGPFLLGKSIDPGSVKFARSIWQIIQQTVPGVTVEGNPFDPTVKFNRFGGLGSENPTIPLAGSSDGSISMEVAMQSNGIAYYLNEVNVSKETINTLTVDDIALIKVLKNEAAVLGASEGVIAVYTKKGVAARNAVYDKAYTIENKEGYAIVKQFFSPNYSIDPAAIKGTDRRITLYWNGHIRPAKDGKYHIRFFNNDTGKKFKLLIQGIDKDGRLIYLEKTIE
jgi:hypothetical protein